MSRATSSSQSTSLHGRELGEWVVRERIGRGGFADVYRAEQPRLEREAVIKVLRPRARHWEMRVRHFVREAKLASQLDHPYAAHVYSFGAEPDGLLWIAMEYVRGITLADLIDTRGPLPLERFVPLFEGLCEVVHTAHEAGLVHRDIKPANVMVITRAGKLLPKLLDFGIAKALGDVALDHTGGSGDEIETVVADNAIDDGWTLDEAVRDTAAEPGTEEIDFAEDATEPAMEFASMTERDQSGVAGTPAFMAPEQWRARVEVDHRVDIYALGVLAYHALTARLPFEGETWRELHDAHLTASIPKLGGDFSEELDAVLVEALAKNPEKRTSSALEVSNAIRVAAHFESNDEFSFDRVELSNWLLLAPPHLAFCLSRVEAAHSPAAARESRDELVAATAQWLGAVSVSAFYALEDDVRQALDVDLSMLRTLRRRQLTPGEWLVLGAAICDPFAERPEHFPVPELVRWFSGSGGFEAFKTLIALSASGDGLHGELLVHILNSLAFLSEYPVILAGEAWAGLASLPSEVSTDESVWLGDYDGAPLFELSPMIGSRAPTPGANVDLFVASGPGRRGIRMTTSPDGFEHESLALAEFLRKRLGDDDATEGRDEEVERPYQGLARFSFEDADNFFGRDSQIDVLFNRLRAQRFVALTGPSGSGKSSIVYAGLLPRLADDWTVLSVRPGRAPLLALAATLAEIDGAAQVPSRLEPLLDYAIDWAESSGRRLLVIVDQAEEILTLTPDAEKRERFAAALARLADAQSGNVRVLLTIRDDYIGRADALPTWRDRIANALVLISTPSDAELREMIVSPATRAGVAFEDKAIVSDMVAEVAGKPGALPMLSFAGARLWEQRDQQNRLLTRHSYEEMGGVAGALASYAEEVLSSMPRRQQGVVRQLFRHLVTGEGTRSLAARDELATIHPDAAEVIETLTSARLLVASEREDGGDYVSIIHEALLERWPRLVRWRDEDAANTRLRAEFRDAAGRWRERGKDDGYLWRGDALRSLRAWQDEWKSSLTAAERDFVKASNDAESRGRRRRRLVVAVAVIVLAAAVILLTVLNRQATKNETRAEERLTDLLLERGRAELLAERSNQALVFLNEAFRRGRDGPGLRVSLALAASGVERSAFNVMAHPGRKAVLARAGKTFVSYAGGESKIWRVNSSRIELLAELDVEGVTGAAVAPDESMVATIGEDNTIRIWAVDGSLRSQVVEARSSSSDIAFSPSGDFLVSGVGNGLALWDLDAKRFATLGEVAPAIGNQPLRGLAFGNDDSKLAVTRWPNIFEVWNPLTRERLSGMTGDAIGFLHLTDDDSSLVAGSILGTIFKWRVSDGELLFSRKAHKSAAYVQKGDDWLATSGRERRIRFWDPETGDERAAIETAVVAEAIVASESGEVLAVSNGASLVFIFERESARPIATIDNGADVYYLELITDELLLTSGLDGRLRLHDISEEPVNHYSGHNDRVSAVAFSPDGKRVATLGHERIHVWDAASGKEITRIPSLPRTTVVRIAFSPDGTKLLAGQDLDAAIWDIESGLHVALIDADSSIGGIAWDPSGERVAVIDQGNSRPATEAWVLVSDVESDRVVDRYPLDGGAVDLAYSPDGDLIALARDHSVDVIDLKTGELAWSAPATGPRDVEFSPSGSLITASSQSGFLRIWNSKTGELHRNLRLPSPNALGVGFVSEELVVSGSDEGLIHVWDIESGELAGALRGHRGNVMVLEASSASRSVVALSRTGEITVWTVPHETRGPGELAAIIDERVPFHLDGIDLVYR